MYEIISQLVNDVLQFYRVTIDLRQTNIQLLIKCYCSL